MSNQEYEVEKLLAHQPCTRYPGTIEYLIKWRNFGSDENSWEREENVYSKHLIEAYWNKNKTSRKDFLKSINPKRKTRPEESPKKSTKKSKKHVNEEESSNTHKYGTSDTVELSLAPEKGLQWSDLKKVIAVFHSERNGLFSEAKWSNNTTTYIPNFIIRDNQPSVLIQYYEALLEFRS